MHREYQRDARFAIITPLRSTSPDWLAMKLECLALVPEPPPLQPARPMRTWMDQTDQRYAYRCLPLNIANSYGWEILCPFDIVITWNGGDRARDITVRGADGRTDVSHLAISHFNHGVITFHTGYLFRTAPGWDILTTGPMNEPKDGIAPLAGIIETDWLPFPFTMNWKLTRAGEVRFVKGEPFCLIVPLQRGLIENIEPEIYDLHERPELVKEYEAWSASRAQFLEKLGQNDAETVKQAWQRFYFQGRTASGPTETPGHSSKLRLKTPLDKRKSKRR